MTAAVPVGGATGDGAAAAAERALEAIARLDPDLCAFVHVDPDAVRSEARRLDATCSNGPLLGLTIGVKDVFDTRDAPTEHGSPIYRGRQPGHDASCVAMLRAAGALIVGKTATAELACMHPTATRNPHDRQRTPGGSSSGSAAAVAAGMVDAALGTQTAASVSRPASYCGVVGYKPTYGLISRAGVLECAQSLDTVGTFAGDVQTAAAAVAAMARDETIAQLDGVPRAAKVAVLVPHRWADITSAAADAAAAIGDGFAALGADVAAIELPPALRRATEVHRVIMRYELARSYAPLYGEHRDDLSATLIGIIEEGLSYGVAAYAAAEGERRAMAGAAGELFDDYDLIVSPAANGEAPPGLASTGDPSCTAPWTMLGVPIVTVPAGTGDEKLPIGVNVIGRWGSDRLLLNAARTAS